MWSPEMITMHAREVEARLCVEIARERMISNIAAAWLFAVAAIAFGLWALLEFLMG